jgi:hypothetical protein
MIISELTSGQIKITSTGNPKGEESYGQVMEEHDDWFYTTTKYDTLKISFRNMDLYQLNKYFTPELKGEYSQLQKLFKYYTSLFNKSDSVNYYEEINLYQKVEGLAQFNSNNPKIGELKIKYTVKRSAPIVERISIYHNNKLISKLPANQDRIDSLENELMLFSSLNDKEKLEGSIELVRLLEKQKSVAKDYKFSMLYGNMSFYACIMNKPNDALKYGRKALKYSPQEKLVLKNIALAYVIKNKPEKAYKYYNELFNTWGIRGSHYTKLLIDDLEKVKKAGVEINNYNEYMDFLINAKNKK